MDDSDMSQPMAWPHIGYTYFPRVRGIISMALKVNTPYNNENIFASVSWSKITFVFELFFSPAIYLSSS